MLTWKMHICFPCIDERIWVVFFYPQSNYKLIMENVLGIFIFTCTWASLGLHICLKIILS